MMTTISIRQRFDLYLTNTKDHSLKSGPYDLEFPESPTFNGTPSQIIDEINEFKRLSGGCAIGIRITRPKTNEAVPLADVQEVVCNSDYNRAKR